VAALKKIALFAAGVVGQRFATGLEDQQEVMADLADMVVEVFAVESALLRAQKMAGSGAADFAAAVTGLLAQDSLAQVEQAARRVVAACADGDMLRTQLAILRRLSRHSPANTVALGRTVAQRCVQAEKYPL
jgi:alkylation response protein AidB-like acyl-CoA dehydrogenase